MAEVTKKSRMSIVQETTEASLKMPSSGSDFLALQDGFSTDLSVDFLESAEIKASIGKAQGIVGSETPKASVSHYLRHSGVEGQAPQSGYSKLLKTGFGLETVNATEYDTVSGSTTSIIKVDTGEGALFSIGQALLVKHASYPWEIAVIKSISGDDLSVLFKLDNAPVAGTNLGKSVFYNVNDAGTYPTLSIHDYRGNGGAYAAIAGARVTGTSIEATANQLLNASFDLEGVSGFFDPIEISSTDRYIDFTDDDGTAAAIIEAKIYKTPDHLAAAIQSAMRAVSTKVATVTYSSSTGKFTIKTTGTLLSLLFSTGTNVANSIANRIGFAASDYTGTAATTGYTSPTAQSWSSPYTPSFDSPGSPLLVKNHLVMVGSSSDNVCFKAQKVSYKLDTPKTDIEAICAETGKLGSIINERSVSVSMTAILEKHKADLFYKMIENQSVSWQYCFGAKSGSNYVAGQSGCLHIKEASVTAHKLGDNGGLVTLDIELKGFVDSNANAETALNLL